MEEKRKKDMEKIAMGGMCSFGFDSWRYSVKVTDFIFQSEVKAEEWDFRTCEKCKKKQIKRILANPSIVGFGVSYHDI